MHDWPVLAASNGDRKELHFAKQGTLHGLWFVVCHKPPTGYDGGKNHVHRTNLPQAHARPNLQLVSLPPVAYGGDPLVYPRD